MPAVPSLPGDYRIELFSAQSAVSAADIAELWQREGAVVGEEVQRRLSELLVVALHAHDVPVGVSTSYLAYQPQLRAELWHTRVFVARGHRQSHLAVALAVRARDELIRRFQEGTEGRGIGVVFNVESPLLKRHEAGAVWARTKFAFIGENQRGDHVRVYYFPGALAPEP